MILRKHLKEKPEVFGTLFSTNSNEREISISFQFGSFHFQAKSLFGSAQLYIQLTIRQAYNRIQELNSISSQLFDKPIIQQLNSISSQTFDKPIEFRSSTLYPVRYSTSLQNSGAQLYIQLDIRQAYRIQELNSISSQIFDKPIEFRSLTLYPVNYSTSLQNSGAQLYIQLDIRHKPIIEFSNSTLYPVNYSTSLQN